MRKVTASAFILTALTGCSQNSGVPSSQWSFQVPNESGQKVGVQTQAKGASTAQELSADAQPFVSKAEIMGPAFEQPATDAGANFRRSSTTANSLTVGSASKGSFRPDPVAQLRAYLSSSGSPSALVGRQPASAQPYTSQVYLSTVPTVTQSFEPSALLLPEASGSEGANPSSGFAAPNASLNAPVNYPSPGIPAGSSGTAIIEPAPAQGSGQFQGQATDPLTSTNGGYPSAGASNSFMQPSPTSDAPVSLSTTSSTTSSEGLPVLVPGAPELALAAPAELPEAGFPTAEGIPAEVVAAESYAVGSQASQGMELPVAEERAVAAPTAEEDAEEISIGTAIVRDLQQRAIQTQATPQAVELASPEVQLGFISPPSTPVTAAAPSLPTSETFQSPTLARLAASMPVRRDVSALSSKLRASRKLAEAADFEAGVAGIEESVISPADELEFSDDVSDVSLGYGLGEAAITPLGFGPGLSEIPELQTDYAYSPLLEGLVSSGISQSQSLLPVEATLVPDALDASASAIQTAVDALNAEVGSVSIFGQLAEYGPLPSALMQTPSQTLARAGSPGSHTEHHAEHHAEQLDPSPQGSQDAATGEFAEASSAYREQLPVQKSIKRRQVILWR